MYRLIQFLKRYYVLFLFVILEVAAINFYAGSTSYSKARYLAATTRVTGVVGNLFAAIGDYFTLSRDNERLLERLAVVEDELLRYQVEEFELMTVPVGEYPFHYIAGKVISNSVSRPENYFVVNRGYGNGVRENSAVLSADGAVIGYVQDVSEKFSVCMSILNRNFRIGGQLLDREHFGSVAWDGTDSRFVTLSDIPRYAVLEQGDTVLSAYSIRFPENSLIGIVESLGESEDETHYEIKVRLAARMTALSDVMIVSSSDFEELDALAGEYMTDRPRPEPAQY